MSEPTYMIYQGAAAPVTFEEWMKLGRPKPAMSGYATKERAQQALDDMNESPELWGADCG